MSSVEYTISIPEGLVREAAEIGLSMPQAVEQLLREELRRRRGAEFIALADRAASLQLPPMTMEEIQAEIDAVRGERRRKCGS
jgi:hypothetical protein